MSSEPTEGVSLWWPVAPTPWGTGGTCPPLLQMAGHRGTVSRRTANKKLTIVYWPSRKRLPKRLIVLLEPKSGGARPKNFFPALHARSVPPHFCSRPVSPHLQIRSGATGCGRVFSHPPIGYDLATRKWNSGLENSQCTPFTANQKEAGQRLLTTARFVVTGWSVGFLKASAPGVLSPQISINNRNMGPLKKYTTVQCGTSVNEFLKFVANIRERILKPFREITFKNNFQSLDRKLRVFCDFLYTVERKRIDS